MSINGNLDRGRLRQLLEGFADPGSVRWSPLKSAEQAVFKKDGKDALLNIYFKADGTTTLDDSAGRNREVSNQAALYLKEKATISELVNFTYSLSEIDELTVSDLLSLLDAIGCKSEDKNDPNTSICKQFTGPNSDRVIVKYYDRTRRLLIQGKPIHLYAEITAFLSEKVDIAEILKVQSQIYKVEIDPVKTKYEVESHLSKSKGFLGETLMKIITPALVLRRLEISMPDYSSFVFPALRCLEGYVKKLFATKGIAIDKYKGFKDLFAEAQPGVKARLKEDIKTRIGCQKTVAAIENAYGYYVSHRHTLFHVAEIPEASRIISNKQDADTIISKTLEIIETTYLSLGR